MKTAIHPPRLLLVLLLLATCLAGRAGTVTNLTLAIPGADWALEFNAPGFVLQKSGFSPDGTAAQLAAVDLANNIIISAFVEPAIDHGDARQCRDYYWSNSLAEPLARYDVSRSETNAFAIIEYFEENPDGSKPGPKNLHAYLATNDCWIDIHLSKPGFMLADRDRFNGILQSIHVNGDYLTLPIVNAFWGSFYMTQSNYAVAARCNERALQLDRAHPGLGHARRILVMEDVINCYGNLGDNEKARRLSEQALKEEPDYPAFYYVLACAEAGLDDKTNALQHLKKAFQNKARLSSDEHLPDPRTDWSFTKYASDPAFVDFYKTLN